MKPLVPAMPMTSLRKEMDRLFDRLWETGVDMPDLGEWMPIVDVTEDKEYLIAKVEVPGIDPKDIHVSFKDQVLTIRGEKKQHKEEKDEHVYHMERNFGTFSRSLRLPVPVDEKKVAATFKHGLLTVRLPKLQGGAGLTIPIKEE